MDLNEAACILSIISRRLLVTWSTIIEFAYIRLGERPKSVAEMMKDEFWDKLQERISSSEDTMACNIIQDALLPKIIMELDKKDG